MSRGRPEKPDALKALAGNPGKRALAAPTDEAAPGAAEPEVVTSSTPKPPSWLDKIGAEQWHLEYPNLANLYLRSTDLTGFAIYCAAVSRFRKAKRVIDKKGLTYTTQSGYVRERPEVKILEKAERTIRSFQDSLAANPLSRIRGGSIVASKQLNLPLTPSGDRPGATPTPKDAHDPVGFAVH